MDATLVSHYECGDVVRRDLEFVGGYRTKFFEDVFKRKFETGYGITLHLEDKIVIIDVTISEFILERNGIQIIEHKEVQI